MLQCNQRTGQQNRNMGMYYCEQTAPLCAKSIAHLFDRRLYGGQSLKTFHITMPVHFCCMMQDNMVIIQHGVHKIGKTRAAGRRDTGVAHLHCGEPGSCPAPLLPACLGLQLRGQTEDPHAGPGLWARRMVQLWALWGAVQACSAPA